MRILLATEGPSEDVVGARLAKHLYAPTTADPELLVDQKQFTARGLPVVLRAIPNLAVAAHFGYYDILMVQFDLNGSMDPRVSSDYTKCERWTEVKTTIDKSLLGVRKIMRVRPVQVALMAGCQSTDAWLCWGNEGGEAKDWERMDRHLAKARLYGEPPRGLVAKSEGYVEKLIARMAGDENWPGSLRFFAEQLRAAYAMCQQVYLP